MYELYQFRKGLILFIKKKRRIQKKIFILSKLKNEKYLLNNKIYNINNLKSLYYIFIFNFQPIHYDHR